MKLVRASGWYAVREDEAEEVLEVLAGVPGVKIRETSIEVHKTHLPLLPEKLRPKSSLSNSCAPCFKPPFELRDYQKEAFRFSVSRAATLLLHDLGMGKTVMALMAMHPPSLFIVPTSAVFGWKRAGESMGMKVQILTGKYKRGVIDQFADLYLVTYGSAGQWLGAFKRMGEGPKLDTLGADEIHLLHKKYLKAAQAFRGTACKLRIGLTATPIRNRLPSLWGILDALSPGAWGSRFEFMERYADAYMGTFGMEVGTPQNIDELSKRVSEVAIRRTWNEPGMDKYRPKLVRKRIEVPIGDKARVRRLDEAVRQAMNKKRLEGGTLRVLSAQRKETGKLKVEWLIESGKLAEEVTRGRRTIWWCWFKEQAKALYDAMKEWRIPVDMITGESLSKKRAKILDEWENGNSNEARVLVATQGALNFAVNLTTATAAYFIEYDWAPVNLVQAEKRHHRPGNRLDVVYANYFVIPGTTDDSIATALYTKIEEEELIFGNTGSLDQVSMLAKDEIGVSTTKVLSMFAERILNGKT